MEPYPKVIVALDYENAADSLVLVDKLLPELCAIKIGLSLFTAAGPNIVKACIAKGFQVFLDLKFHDIPNTVASALRVAADLGVFMVNVHALGGFTMLQAAREAIDKNNGPLLIAVTILTSHEGDDLKAIGITNTIDQEVKTLAKLAFNAGCDGIVCSPWEVKDLKKEFGQNFLAVTPGIHLKEDNKDDQKRIMTPQEALKAGSDYLVMGRSITRATSPREKLKAIIEALESE
ncbi:MAG: orotidine 5'-phosphate decarboxylase [Legionellales bacterium RIFCSPHIGHO2_12_FULL_37_14]|nr:MAG: orotidine 5'-phosphate decarboxylase [Legionellales bacterium RIFCSPHIGHO2_12_FULL_37_14]